MKGAHSLSEEVLIECLYRGLGNLWQHDSITSCKTFKILLFSLSQWIHTQQVFSLSYIYYIIFY